ncbi:MAG: class I SAM-dependent methyltransferase [Isosphaera sp.]|nr:class I SAM-dependent methyltransferase [Isosphaera sp.]
MSSWDPVWEKVFSAQRWGKYPPEELIRFVARNFYKAPDRSAVRVLEVGCGAGANLWFLAREGFSAAGIDGSASAIRQAAENLAADGLTADLRVGDAAQLAEHFPAGHFDAVIDNGCLVCNMVAGVRKIVAQMGRVLKPGGRVYSATFARGTYGDGMGREVEPGTFTDIPDGVFAGKGIIHLFTEDEVREVFGAFSGLNVECYSHTLGGQQQLVKRWVLDGVKAA